MIGRKLAQYQLVEKIGEGGMGAVWKAQDTRLGRDVAIKLLPEGFARDRDRVARLEREARMLASLSHPNIVTLYNVEQSEGLHFLVMELVVGRTLDQLIPSTGLPPETFFELAIPLTAAVAAAHERQITHRDLKPANVIVGDDGRLRVLDFGLAKLTDRGGPTTDLAATATIGATAPGTVLGTWAYMAPEQAEGQAIDSRTDIFSLGVLLYEMATGGRPFQGSNPAQLVSAILRDRPVPIEQLRPDLPAALGRVLLRCLEKEPRDRFADARELASALDRSRGATAGSPASALASDERQSIAVLPFSNLSGDPGDEFFSDGVTEEIINALSTVKGLRVAARTSAFSFKGRAVDISEIARKLDVANVLEGSVRKAGNRLRITAQLVDVSDGCHLWSERFDREMDDIFSVQDEIASAIASRFEAQLGERTDAPLVRTPTRNLEAYEEYLRGRHAWLQFGKDTYIGLGHCKRAVELDPEFAPAWAGVADAYGTLGFTGAMDPREAMPLSQQAAERALALDDRLAEAHCALGHWQLVHNRDWAAAEVSLLRSIELNPNYSQAFHHYGHLFHAFVSHRLDAGIELCRRAAEVDPFGGFSKHGWLANLYVKGDFDQAVARLTAELKEDSDAFHLRRLLGLCFLDTGRLDEAQTQLEMAVQDSGRHPWAVAELGLLHARAGRVELADSFQAELLARAKTGYMQGTTLAMIPGNLGRMDEAYGWLERAFAERDPIVLCITNWPTVRPLHDDPRYDPFLQRLGLERLPVQVD